MNARYLAVLLALLPGAAAVAQPPPTAAFAALPAMESPAVSPDGERLGAIARGERGAFVYAARLATNQAEAVVQMGDELNARAVVWASDDSMIMLTSETETTYFAARMAEVFVPFGIDLSGDLAVRQLGGARAVGGGFFVRARRLIGYEPATGRVLVGSGGGLYAVNARGDDRARLEDTAGFTRDWVVDADGAPLFRVDYRDRTDDFQILRRTDRGFWEPFVERTLDLPEIDLHGLDAQGDLVIGLRPPDVGRYGLYTLTPGGTLGRAIYTHDTLDLSDVRVDQYTNRVVGAAVEGEIPVWFDEDLSMLQASLDDTFADGSPWIENWSRDRSLLIVRTTHDDRPTMYYLFDANERTATAIGTAYPALEGVRLAPRLPYAYEARDGAEIPGYLTRPLGVEGPAPLVLLPHRGPMFRDVEGFHWLAHFLASRGYVVLQPNYRGSSGYGRAWEDAGHGGWGIGVMQHDLTDGVAALVAAGIADPERVCIVGLSYGGYAALAGAAFTPELYRCAAAINGVSDLREIYTRYTGFRDDRSAAMTYFERSLGIENVRSPREMLDAASPVEHADNVQAAVLLIHGSDDPVVPIGQSRRMERVLGDAGKTVRLVELEGEDPWLSEAATRLQTLDALETFLAEHLSAR